jgi:hypothetical protein
MKFFLKFFFRKNYLKDENSKNLEENRQEKSNDNQFKNSSHFHFFNKLCHRAFLPQQKKSFFLTSQKVLNKKFSVENVLELDIKFQVVKNLIFEEDESKLIEHIPLFKLTDHLNENYKL